MSLNWFINRLKTMSLAEVGFRVGQVVRNNIEKRTQTKKFPDKTLLQPPPRIFDNNSSNFNSGRTLKVFDLEIDFFDEINWHLDIATGKEFPHTFSKDIDIRTDKYGSAKYVWEVNRMQFLPKLCMNYKSSQDPQYLQLFMAINTSWISQNPYLIGVNWYSNIEVNIRLINWFLCWEILNVNELIEQDADFKTFVETKWVPLIYLHCKYSYENPSKYSSANNHLISEGAGLFIAASFWKFEESAKWSVYAKEILEEEILKQHSACGVNKEEAAEYIQFITDFFLLSYLVGKNNGNPFSQQYEAMLKNIFFYILHLMDINGTVIYYGDEDDGRTFILETETPFNNFKSLLTSGSIIFQDKVLKAKSNGFDSKNQILFGSQDEIIYKELGEKPYLPQSKFYQDEGHFVLRKTKDDQEIFIHFNVAPLGFLSIAAHGHADVLSFTMSIDGIPVFIDSGTYTYHTEFEWRKYFMGALSHNTIRVNKKDPASIAGPTMWRNHYQPKVVAASSTNTRDHIVASHNGYHSLGLIHQRTIDFDKVSEKITIVDDLVSDSQEKHLYEIPFHIHPEVQVTTIGHNTFLLKTKGDRHIHLKLDQQLEPSIIEGQSQPIFGWYSHSFQKKQPCPVIYSQLSKDQSFKLSTEITIQNNEH